jgi:hypothetical protein
MNYMVRILIYIMAAAWAAAICGCQPAEQKKPPKPEVSIEGITIKDLKPADTTKLPPRIVFRIFTFEVPAEKVQTMLQAFATLDTKSMRFVNRESFDANGFKVGFGRTLNWKTVSGILSQIGAVREETKNLVVYDDSGDDFVVAILESQQNISFFDTRGREGASDFMPGRFSWTLRARPSASVRGVVQLEIRPQYRFGADSFISRLADYRNVIPFDGGAFGLKMSSGEFVLLGTTGRSAEKITLSNLLFSKPQDNSVVLLYMIGCVGIGD